jgi:mono/diheme cytochrome c family protein
MSRFPINFLSTLILGAALLPLSLPMSCSKRSTKIQYMPDMADSPAVKAHESYIDPPAGSVAKNAVYYPASPAGADAVHKNPLRKGPITEEILKKGQWGYETYCAVCHGPQGKGNLSLSEKYPLVPPNITGAPYSGYTDGELYYRITFGWANMPGYGDKLTDEERWPLVLYVRKLQGKL